MLAKGEEGLRVSVILVYVFTLALWFVMVRNNYIAFTKYKKYVRELNPFTDFLMKKVGLIPTLMISTSALIGLLALAYMAEGHLIPAFLSVIFAIANVYESAQLASLEEIGMLNEALNGLYQMENWKKVRKG